MLVDSLLLLGVVGWVAGMIMLLLYYTLVVEQVTPYDADQNWEQHPVSDDEMIYLASSVYPPHEFAHLTPLPLKLSQQDSSL